MVRIALAAGLVVALGAGSADAGIWGTSTISRLAGEVPAEAMAAGGEIVLIDVGAVRAELASLPVGDRRDRALLPFGHLNLPRGFDQSGLLIYDMPATMGFSLDDIEGVAGWGRPPWVPVVMVGSTTMQAAMDGGETLAARGFERRMLDGVPVWHRGDDNSIDIGRRMEDPFTGGLGKAARYAMRGDFFYFSTSWEGLEYMLAERPSIRSDPDAAAFLEVHDSAEIGGRPTQLLILVEPMSQGMALTGAVLEGRSAEEVRAELAGGSPPVPPPYARLALMEWQDGATLAGALALSYADRADAESALARVKARLNRGAQSIATRRPFTELLPDDREFLLVEAAGRHVALIVFRREVDVSGGLGLITLMSDQPLRRLHQMYVRLDLPFLIGPE